MGMHERMAAYQYVYGLKPNGPHRPLADRLLTPLRITCERCEGRGLCSGPDVNRWYLCSVCEGTRGFWSRSPEEIEAVRREVLQAFPDAAVGSTPANFVSPTLALKLATGCIVELTEEPD